MNFNKHLDLVGEHALLGASSYHWLNYSDDKLIEYYDSILAKARGTELHEFAAQCIKLGRKLRGTDTIALYVNDAIGFKMTPEQPLAYSKFCFGTTDAICFRKNFLRIHDLKTGKTPASFKQLLIYAALFCLEYNIKPSEIEVELRIYQSNEVNINNPTVEEIVMVMDAIVNADKILSNRDEED